MHMELYSLWLPQTKVLASFSSLITNWMEKETTSQLLEIDCKLDDSPVFTNHETSYANLQDLDAPSCQ